MKIKFAPFSEITKAMGLVFGDIGTSPIYTLVIIFTLTEITEKNVFGILSLIFWSLIIIVTIQYAWLAMNLSIKGEGGVIVLKEIIVSLLKKSKQISFASFLGYIGISLLMGDGVITPAISILSAIEGMPLIPGFEMMTSNEVIIITIVITFLLFLFQYKGSDKVASSFGPIMILWFLSLFISGIISIANMPEIIKAINPIYAVDFFTHHGFVGFLVLSEVILCATGGEALYADMGHLGSKPIRNAWLFVFIALIMNYFGQGVYALQHKESNLILFEMVRTESTFFYIPFLILTILATIIASQAMISAVFSLVYQGITTRLFPLMKIKFTSTHLKSQIYIGSINWILFVAVIFIILVFRESKNLAAAYGLAVTVTMTISASFLIWIFERKKNYFKMAMSILVLIVDLIFLFSVLTKLPHGGYWSLIIASLPLFIIFIWLGGQNKIYRSFRALPFDIFQVSYEQIYKNSNKIKGTALFFAKSVNEIPAYMAHCIISSNIIYERNIIISIERIDKPYGVSSEMFSNLTTGLDGIVIKAGYLEILDIQSILKQYDIDEKVIFYGVEDIITKNILLKIYSFIKKITPNFIQFYKLPFRKIHGVITRVEI